MVDALGYRKKFGVIAPSTNTIVGPDFHTMAVPGVTPHVSRIHIHNPDLSSDDRMLELLEQIRGEIFLAVDRVLTAKVDYLVMGMSAETFWGGKEGGRKFIEAIEQHSGLKVASGSAACEAALRAVGAKRVAVLTPYQAIADTQVRTYFGDIGVEVIRLHALRCPSATSIAEVSEAKLRSLLQELDGDDIDAIVQVGTNLSMLRLADEAERWLDKPVIAINAATWWHALRQNDITDQMSGFGCLLRDH